MPDMREDTHERRTALYHLFHSSGQLLYVGIACDPKERFRGHARDKFWWPHVADKRITWYPNRDEAACAERHAIVTETPRFNIVMNNPEFRTYFQVGWLDQTLRAEEKVLCTPRKPRSKAGKAALADIHRRQRQASWHKPTPAPTVFWDGRDFTRVVPRDLFLPRRQGREMSTSEWSGCGVWPSEALHLETLRVRNACAACGQPYPCHTLREIIQPFADLPGYCF